MKASQDKDIKFQVFERLTDFIRENRTINYLFDIEQLNCDYKVVVLKYQLSDKEKEKLLSIRNLFNKKDLRVEVNEDDIYFFVRRLNLEKIQNLINGNESLSRLLELLISKLGSYTIEGQYRVYKGFNSEKKVKKRKQKAKKRGRIFYAKKFDKPENLFPEKYTNKIICGDSEKILKEFPDNSVDLILTSPPYNFGLDYEKLEDAIRWEHYFDKLFRIFKECIRILKFGGRIAINIQPLFSDYIPTHHIISDFFRGEGLIWRNEIIWEKNNYNCKYTAWGSWKSPSSPYFKYTWEFIEVFAKGDIKKKGKRDNADITEEEFKRWTVAKWSIAPEKDMKKYGHPAMFPEELAYRIIKLFSFKGDLVLDPFNGAGTTTVAAKKLGRRYVGIDISHEYCEVAERRLRGEI
jgi:DNA modification methylase